MLTVKTTRLHLMQVDQSLNRELAGHILRDNWITGNNDLLADEFGSIFDRLMNINPTAEIYLLDQDGVVLRYSAPPERIKLDQVATEPIAAFVGGSTDFPIIGDDPRDPEQQKAFSAAPIQADGQLKGYLYVVLGGEAYRSAASMFEGSQILRLSLLITIVGLVLAMVLGGFTSYRLAGRLRKLAGSMTAFSNADFHLAPEPIALVPSTKGDEIDALIANFNGMARRIHDQLSTLEAVDESRRELIMHISHDLKTPLATLNGYLETLMMRWEQLSQDQRQVYLASSLAFSRQLGQMIADLFELAQLDTVDGPLKQETFSMDELVQDVCMRFRFDAERKEVALDTEIEAPGHFVTADIGLIERALANLIDNAIKFTPAGGSVQVSVDQRDDEILTQITDTGVGMPGRELANIFDRFYRIERQQKEAGGTGLGLAIAKRIVELHDGRIDVTSKINEGATFTIGLHATPPLSGELSRSPSAEARTPL
jgi:signal transduction histidine kinase